MARRNEELLLMKAFQEIGFSMANLSNGSFWLDCYYEWNNSNIVGLTVHYYDCSVGQWLILL